MNSYCHHHGLRFLRGGPANPGQLTVTGWIIHMVHAVAFPSHRKCDRHRIIWITLASAHLYRCDDFCVGPVLIIIGTDFRFLWRGFVKPYHTKTQGTFDLTVGTDSRCRSAPCRISQIWCFQKHGKREVLKRHSRKYRPHPPA